MFVPTRIKQALIAAVWCACIGGCATQITTAGVSSAKEAQAALVIGKSTKAEVEAALGKPIAVHFDSGYEVWVYRERSAAGSFFAQPARERPELVLLFEPSGVLKKSRIRLPA